MSNKIFVVASGDYSDYGIDGVFTTRELAEKFISVFATSSYDRMSVEEWDLNPNEKHFREDEKPYFLRINKEGFVSEIKIPDSAYGYKHDIPEADVSYTFDKKLMNVNCFAKDETHAIKIANERRVQIIASNLWGLEKYEIEKTLA